MNILLLGSGGREHALAWKMAQSPNCTRLFIAPGNGGTSMYGTNLPISATDAASVLAACREHSIDLVVVGPEEPLVHGIVDALRNDIPGLKVIGPTREAAQLEGSKAFAKAFMNRHNIPTASYREFTEDNYTEGVEYLKTLPLPIVLKADGLAAGKGVIICQNHVEAVAEFELMIQRSKFGEAGKRVVVEAFLSGIELSVFVLTDGKDYLLLPEAKDYKRAGEGDSGPNTGGMGAISPVPFADAAFMQKVEERIIRPTVEGLAKDGLDYRGFIFFGLISVEGAPMVIEYNCRMGDPETEVVMPRLRSDLVALLTATAEGTLKEQTLTIDPRHAATIMAVSGGYPDNYEKGFTISGMEHFRNRGGSYLFQSGTGAKGDGLVTTGGRVFCITTLADTLEEAVEGSKEALEHVSFEGMFFRRDIGYEFIS